MLCTSVSLAPTACSVGCSRRNDNGSSRAKHLPNIDVGAVRSNVGVIGEQSVQVRAGSVGNTLAEIALLNDVDNVAVLSRNSETDVLSGEEVGAQGIDEIVVSSNDLE